LTRKREFRTFSYETFSKEEGGIMANMRLAFQVTEEMRKALEEAARREELSLSDILRRAVRLYLRLYPAYEPILNYTTESNDKEE